MGAGDGEGKEKPDNEPNDKPAENPDVKEKTEPTGGGKNNHDVDHHVGVDKVDHETDRETESEVETEAQEPEKEFDNYVEFESEYTDLFNELDKDFGLDTGYTRAAESYSESNGGDHFSGVHQDHGANSLTPSNTHESSNYNTEAQILEAFDFEESEPIIMKGDGSLDAPKKKELEQKNVKIYPFRDPNSGFSVVVAERSSSAGVVTERYEEVRLPSGKFYNRKPKLFDDEIEFVGPRLQDHISYSLDKLTKPTGLRINKPRELDVKARMSPSKPSPTPKPEIQLPAQPKRSQPSEIREIEVDRPERVVHPVPENPEPTRLDRGEHIEDRNPELPREHQVNVNNLDRYNELLKKLGLSAADTEAAADYATQNVSQRRFGEGRCARFVRIIAFPV